MKIDFNLIDEKTIDHFRGGEKQFATRMFTYQSNKIMRGRLASGASIGMHTHADDCEIIYILSGSGKVLFDDQTEQVAAGDCHYCPKGHRHSLINDSDEELLFFAVVAAQ